MLSNKLFIATIITSAAALAPISQALADDKNNQSVLTVTGIGETLVEADIARVSLGVEVTSATANTVRKKLASITEEALEKIKDNKPLEVQTSGLSIWPVYDQQKRDVLLNYKGYQSITFEAKADEAGKIIDAAMDAGANKMNGYTLVPSDEVLMNGKIKALKIASENAKKQAKVVLNNFNLDEKKIKAINIIDYDTGYQPRLGAMMQKTSAGTTVTESKQTVKAGVSVTIKFDD